MLGFRIEGQGIFLEVASETVYAIFSLVKMELREEINLDIRGTNNFFEEQLDWGSWKLENGDELLIKVVDVKNVSKPKKKEMKKTLELQLKEELTTYFSLKQELENAKLL